MYNPHQTTKNYVAIVTGSTTGIGYHLVRLLAEIFPNWTVVMTSRRKSSKIAHDKCLEDGFENIDYYCPLVITESNSRNAFAQWLQKCYPAGIDLLVNNASTCFRVNSTEKVGTQASLTFKTNFEGTMKMCDLIMPNLKDNGIILNVASWAGRSCLHKLWEPRKKVFLEALSRKNLIMEISEYLRIADAQSLEGLWQWGAHCTTFAYSKLTIIALTEILAKEVKPELGITILSACPGWCRSFTGGYTNDVPLLAHQGAQNLAWVITHPNIQKFHGQFLYERKVENWKVPVKKH